MINTIENTIVSKVNNDGDDWDNVEVRSIVDKLTTEDVEIERVLGVQWNPWKDIFKFSVRINLNLVRKESRVRPDLTREELSINPPKFIMR